MNRTPSGTRALRFNGNGANIELKQRVDGVTAGQRYYLGSFGTVDSGTPGGAVGLSYGWGANNYPPPNYQNCAFSYAHWDGTVASFDLLSCDFVVPAGYNYVAPKMSFNAASPHWGVTDDWYLKPVPNKTTSRYVTSRDPNTFYNWGFTAGQNGESGRIILDFGQPWYDGANYGAWSWTNPQFITISAIKIFMQSFFRGYWDSRGASGPAATIVVGTNNQGGYTGYAHGANWSAMILDLSSYISQMGMSSRLSVVAGSDIESAWSSPAAVNDWINGYQSIPGVLPYFDFGSADGAPWDLWYYDANGVGHAGCPNCNGANGWVPGDYRYVAWGASSAWPLPEIYRTDGVNASQWYRVDLINPASKMWFVGTLTQRAACTQVGCPKFCAQSYCASTNNSPGMGWGQLNQFLNFDQVVYVDITASSDMTW